jgi:TIR domain-containing protein
MNVQAFEPVDRVSIFISSVTTPKDKGLRYALEQGLSPLSRQGLIVVWHDGKINVGREHVQEMSEHLDEARIILLLLSRDSVASDDCYKQMIRAMERHDEGHATVVPILLRPVAWQDSPCGMLKPLPENGQPITSQRDRDHALYSVVEGLRSLILEIQREPEKQ